MKPYRDISITRGGGSAYGGKWKPKKPGDERFQGEPGEIKHSKSASNSKGESYDRDTKIGNDGNAVMERHYTDHYRPDKHTSPHDHPIDWSKGFPDPKPPINYPDGAPKFKKLGGLQPMTTISRSNTFEDNRFESISDFKWCITHGGEVEFEWKGQHFGVFPKLRQTPDSPLQMLISQVRVDDPAATEQWYDTADELLEYIVCGDRLRDVITQVKVWDRTI